MKQLIVTFALLVCSNCFAQLTVSLEKPELLLRQLPSVDIKAAPVLSEQEQEFASVISQHLKAGTLPALLTHLESKLVGMNETSAAMHYLLGQLSLQQGKLNGASRYLQQAVEQESDYVKAWYALGIVYSQQGHYAKASKALSKALELGISDPHIYLYMGYSFIELQAYQNAVLAYQQAKLRLIENQQADKALLYAYSQSGQSQAALALLNQLIDKAPSDKSLWLHRANAYISSEHYDKAISSMETAVRLGENNANNLLLLAQLHMQYGSAQRALALYKLTGPKLSEPKYLFEAVHYFLAQGKTQYATGLIKAISKKRLTRSQDRSELALIQAKLAKHQGSISKALKHLKVSLKHNAVNGEALLYGAQLYRQQGNHHKAQMLLLRAAPIENVSVQALSEHADLMLSLGRYQKAMSYLKKALDIEPNNQQLINNIRLLDRILVQHEA